ncbi:MAG: polymerase [Spirochaetaceae bacterium]|nr:polymerase [Spirochaetaceae bacterium]
MEIYTAAGLSCPALKADNKIMAFIQRNIRAAVIPFVLFVCVSLEAREIKSSVICSLDWEQMRIDAELSVDLAAAGIRLPSGRTQAEEILFSHYFDRVRPFILSIRLDSSSLIGDLVESGEISPALVDALASQASRQAPKYSLDFQTIGSGYVIDLKNVSSKLAGHKQNTRMTRVINPPPVAEYTGIIIIAQDKLPVHGRKDSEELLPCLFPKIWDTEMNLIYDKGMTKPGWAADFAMVHYTSVDSIFQDTPSGLSLALQEIVGNRPLRIIARGVFGINPTDPVIDRVDALTIISSEANKQLLSEGRVAFIAPAAVLSKDL